MWVKCSIHLSKNLHHWTAFFFLSPKSFQNQHCLNLLLFSGLEKCVSTVQCMTLRIKKKLCWKESWGKKHAHISLQVNDACKQKAGFSTPTHWQPLYKQGRHSFGYAWGENKHREVTTNSNAWMTSPLKLDKQWPIHEGGELTRGIQKPEVPLVCHVKLSLLSERGGVGP